MSKTLLYVVAVAAIAVLMAGAVPAFGMMGSSSINSGTDALGMQSMLAGMSQGLMSSGSMGLGIMSSGMMSSGMMSSEMHSKMHGDSGMMQMHTDVKKALTEGNFESFVKIHKAYGMPVKMSKENFENMAKWYKAKSEGDYDTMAKMREEGFMPGDRNMGMHQGMSGKCAMMG